MSEVPCCCVCDGCTGPGQYRPVLIAAVAGGRKTRLALDGVYCEFCASGIKSRGLASLPQESKRKIEARLTARGHVLNWRQARLNIEREADLDETLGGAFTVHIFDTMEIWLNEHVVRSSPENGEVVATALVGAALRVLKDSGGDVRRFCAAFEDVDEIEAGVNTLKSFSEKN